MPFEKSPDREGSDHKFIKLSEVEKYLRLGYIVEVGTDHPFADTGSAQAFTNDPPLVWRRVTGVNQRRILGRKIGDPSFRVEEQFDGEEDIQANEIRKIRTYNK
jgi:hypothetical protein